MRLMGCIDARMRIYRIACVLLLAIGSSGCQTASQLQPDLSYFPPQRLIKQLPSPFAELSLEERNQDWGKEWRMGRSFAFEKDFYRALTCFKRALLLIPPANLERRLEIEYEIFLAYYLSDKFQDAIEVFEGGQLFFATDLFPAIHELLILLYDAYLKNNQPEKALKILTIIESTEQEIANKLNLGSAIRDADFPKMKMALTTTETDDEMPSRLQVNLNSFLTEYQKSSKSISKAKILNAVLPGAGYFYVGQRKSAMTSFIINALFIAAAYQLFDRGYVPAGLALSSLEMGWYFGGINGAGIEAKEYNQYLYQTLGKEMLIENRLFPILMIEKGF
jgi:tetratricopeptide (TPR) repeat protein